MGGTRCWVSTDEGIAGFDAEGADPVAIAAEGYVTLAGFGDVLAVLREATFVLHDGGTGAVRSERPVSRVRNVLAGGGRLWLDESRTARALDAGGDTRSIVELGDGFGVLAVDEDHLATTVLGAYDYGVVRVVARGGTTVLETPRLTDVGGAVLTGDAVVVASAEGVQRFPFDGGPPDVRPGDGRARVVPAPGGWIEVWDDRHGTSSGSRVVQVDGRGDGSERTFDSPVVGVSTETGRMWVLVPQQAAEPLRPVGPVTALELGDDLMTLRTLALGDRDWRGGLAVCVTP